MIPQIKKFYIRPIKWTSFSMIFKPEAKMNILVGYDGSNVAKDALCLVLKHSQVRMARDTSTNI